MSLHAYAEAYPFAYIERDQLGVIVVQVTNVSNPVLGTVAKAVEQLVVTLALPGVDGQVDRTAPPVVLQTPTRIDAEGEVFGFFLITPALLATIGSAVDYVYFEVAASGKSDGTERTTTMPYVGLETTGA